MHRRIWRLTSTRRRSAPPAGDRYSSRRSRSVHEVAHHQRGRPRCEPRDQSRHYPGAQRRNPDEREPAGGPAGERGSSRARAPARRPEPGTAPGARPRRPRTRCRRVRASTGPIRGAGRGASDPCGLPPRRAPRPARPAARAHAGRARGGPRAGALLGSPPREVLRAMGRPHTSRTDRRGRLASPAGRRGPRGRDRVVLPPRLRGARVSLGVCGGARDGAADAVRRTRTAGHPRPGDPPRQLPRPPRARAIRCRARGSDMSTVVMSVYKVASFSEGGGHFWVYLQYALGLRRLGCDVYWLEQLRPARDPEREATILSTFLERMKRYGLEGKTLLYALDHDPGGSGK